MINKIIKYEEIEDLYNYRYASLASSPKEIIKKIKNGFTMYNYLNPNDIFLNNSMDNLRESIDTMLS